MTTTTTTTTRATGETTMCVWKTHESTRGGLAGELKKLLLVACCGPGLGRAEASGDFGAILRA